MSKKLLGFLALIFFIVIASGLLWLAVQSDNAVSALLSFAAGLSMIFLPCTLPLALIIVPLAAKETKAGKGLGVAIAFGLGLSITLALYGIVTAFLGEYFGLDQFTRAMFVVAGTMALLFALTELTARAEKIRQNTLVGIGLQSLKRQESARSFSYRTYAGTLALTIKNHIKKDHRGGLRCTTPMYSNGATEWNVFHKTLSRAG